MQTTTHGGRPLAANDFPARFGAEPAPGRLPLRQRWHVHGTDAAAHAPVCWQEPRLAAAKFALVPQGNQGEIWALNERALREARAAVEGAHPAGVHFTPPQVHTYLDPQRRVPMEPLMFVKVTAPHRNLDAVQQQLRARGARMQEVELQGARVVLRAQALLRDLLGFEDALTALGVRAEGIFTRLARYEAAATGGE